MAEDAPSDADTTTTGSGADASPAQTTPAGLEGRCPAAAFLPADGRTAAGRAAVPPTQPVASDDRRGDPGPYAPPRADIAGTLRALSGTESIPLPRALLSSSEGLVVGRTIGLCHVQIRDPSVSRRHLRLRMVDSVVLVEDLNTLQGTYLDGAALQVFNPRSLHPGQTLDVGGSYTGWRRREVHEPMFARVGAKDRVACVACVAAILGLDARAFGQEECFCGPSRERCYEDEGDETCGVEPLFLAALLVKSATRASPRGRGPAPSPASKPCATTLRWAQQHR